MIDIIHQIDQNLEYLIYPIEGKSLIYKMKKASPQDQHFGAFLTLNLTYTKPIKKQTRKNACP